MQMYGLLTGVYITLHSNLVQMSFQMIKNADVYASMCCDDFICFASRFGTIHPKGTGPSQ